jgi:hypothetical protein
MLTLDTEQTTALDYSVVNTSIQETFTAIDRFEWQAIDELRLMRDNHYYFDGGYLSFEDYCEKELIKYGLSPLKLAPYSGWSKLLTS